MSIYKILAYAFTTITIVACAKEDLSINRPNTIVSSDEEIVFEEASIQYKVSKKEALRGFPTGSQEEWLADDNELKPLGRSYWFKGEDLIERELKAPIINTRTLIKDPDLEGSVVTTNVRELKTESYAYRDYLHTRKENRRYRKVGGGFKISIFRIKLLDFSSSHEKTFYSMNEYFDTSLFGETNVLYYGKDVTLSNSIGVRAGIIERHLYHGFIRDLYNSPMGVVSQSVGPLVLCKYRMGGRLSAKAFYRDTKHSTSDSTYNKFGVALNSVFKIKQKKEEKEGSANLGFDKMTLDTNLEEINHQQLYFSLSTIGGNPELQINFPVLEAEKVPKDTDFSPWIRSLSDMKTHILMDIQEEGLLPISEFILEENFKRRIMDIYKGVLSENLTNKEPKVEITKVFIRHDSSGQPLCDIALVLSTRNEDKLILTPVNETATDEMLRRNDNREEFIRRGRELVTSINHVFKGLKKTGKPSVILYPYLRTTLCTNAVMDYSRLYKYKNPITKIVYLYDEKNKVALSFYQGNEGDKNLEEEYGLSTFVSSLPEKKISIANLLQNYRVLGL